MIGANKGARRGWEAFQLVTKEVSGRDKLKEEIELVMTEMSSGKTNNNNMGLTVAWGGAKILKITIRAVSCPVNFGTPPRLFKLGFHIPSGPCPSASPP